MTELIVALCNFANAPEKIGYVCMYDLLLSRFRITIISVAISITYSDCVFVALVIQHAKRIRRIILSPEACVVLPWSTDVKVLTGEGQRKYSGEKPVPVPFCHVSPVDYHGVKRGPPLKPCHDQHYKITVKIQFLL